jgi:hypothetical protein
VSDKKRGAQTERAGVRLFYLTSLDLFALELLSVEADDYMSHHAFFVLDEFDLRSDIGDGKFGLRFGDQLFFSLSFWV